MEEEVAAAIRVCLGSAYDGALKVGEGGGKQAMEGIAAPRAGALGVGPRRGPIKIFASFTVRYRNFRIKEFPSKLVKRKVLQFCEP
jgi:hypothetical protein